MKRLAYLVLALLPFGASAQGFVDEPTCYSWEGGHKSAGSFSKCGPAWVMPAKKAAPVAVAAPVVPPPVMQSTVCPPQVILQPKKRQSKPRPKPLKC